MISLFKNHQQILPENALKKTTGQSKNKSFLKELYILFKQIATLKIVQMKAEAEGEVFLFDDGFNHPPAGCKIGGFGLQCGYD